MPPEASIDIEDTSHDKHCYNLGMHILIQEKRRPCYETPPIHRKSKNRRMTILNRTDIDENK